MTVKFTMLFNYASNTSVPSATPKRTAGWSESWYHDTNDIGFALDLARNGNFTFGPLLPTRASNLAAGCSIVGQRVQVINPRGPSQTFAFGYPGSAADPQDIPQVALLTKVPSIGSPNVRLNVLRGLRDGVVVEGEFKPSTADLVSLANYFDALGAWRFRGRDLTLPAYPIVFITSGGGVQLTVPHALAAGDMIRVMHTMQSGGSQFGGVFKVEAVGPSSSQLSIMNWTGGATTGGTIRKEAIGYPLVDSNNVSISRIITRRVGRPFVGYRGRRSARR